MGADDALELMRQLLWTTLIVSAPVLVAALAVGLLVSVLQVATQLQEATLSYVPKLLVAVVMLMATGAWMIHRVTGFAISLIKLIPALGR